MTSEEKLLEFLTNENCQEERFKIELRFVECLSNLEYLFWLKKQNYLDDLRFVSYIEYLQYWQTPPYVVFVKYPLALENLKLLSIEGFRHALEDPEVIKVSSILQNWYRAYGRECDTIDKI